MAYLTKVKVQITKKENRIALQDYLDISVARTKN